MKIYTKQGDKGFTRLGNGASLGKDEVIVDALGQIDELNAVLGYAVAQHRVDKRIVEKIQSNLLHLGAELALSKSKYETIEADIVDLENQIDFFQRDLPELKNFILPGGSPASAWIHYCRSVCRRAERAVVSVLHEGIVANSLLVTYLNRLSDFLFVFARSESRLCGSGDVVWKPK